MNKRRMISVKGMAVMLAMIFFACKEEVPVTGVKTDQTALMLTPGETAVLTAAVTPANATVQTVSWSAAPAGAVTLTDNKDGSCTVTAVGAGTATVTVTTADGGKTAQCEVTVNEKPIPVTGVTLDQTALTLTVEETAVLTATVTPAEATVQTVSWSAEPEGAVTLTDNKDGSCTVTAVGAGTATVTVTTADGGKTAQCAVNVNEKPIPVTGVTLDKTALTLTDEGTADLTATVTPANATVQTVSWSAEPADAVTLNVDGNRCTVILLRNGTVTVTASVESIKADCTIESRVYIENTAFIAAVGEQCQWTKEENGTVKLTKENRAAMAEVGSLMIESPDVTDLSGIEYFTGLTDLVCYGTGLTTLNVSGCTNLASLQCGKNQLTTLNVSGCTNLTELYCDGNQLKDLNVSDCANLMRLNCSGNQLTTLNVLDCTNLTELVCYTNQLTLLNVSGCTNLTELVCYTNQLTSLNLSGCTSLKYLDCFNNRLTSLDVSGCTSLWHLDCFNNRLTSLDVSGCTSLRRLDCLNNRLTSLDVSDTDLVELFCGNQTSDGATPQTLTLTLNETHKIWWENDWKDNGHNNNVTVAP